MSVNRLLHRRVIYCLILLCFIGIRVWCVSRGGGWDSKQRTNNINGIAVATFLRIERYSEHEPGFKIVVSYRDPQTEQSGTREIWVNRGSLKWIDDVPETAHHWLSITENDAQVFSVDLHVHKSCFWWFGSWIAESKLGDAIHLCGGLPDRACPSYIYDKQYIYGVCAFKLICQSNSPKQLFTIQLFSLDPSSKLAMSNVVANVEISSIKVYGDTINPEREWAAYDIWESHSVGTYELHTSPAEAIGIEEWLVNAHTGDVASFK